MKIKLIALIILLSISTTPAVWWDSDWSYKIDIQIDTDSLDGEQLSDYPLLVKVYHGRGGFDTTHCQSDFGDIRFVDADDATELYADSEKVHSDTLWAWVSVDIDSTPNRDSIFVYYGNAGAASSWNSEAVFDTTNGYEGVWHLAEDDTLTRYDATYNSNDAPTQNYDNDEATDHGKIDGADSLDGGEYLGNIYDPSLHPSYVTVSTWIRTTSIDHVRIFDARNSGDDTYQMAISNLTDGDIEFLADGGSGWDLASIDSSNFADGNWHLMTGTYDGSWIRLYIDGTIGDSTSLSGTMEHIEGYADIIYIGAETDGTKNFKGHLDEIRVKNFAETAEYIQFSYLTQKDESILTFGAEQSIGGVEYQYYWDWNKDGRQGVPQLLRRQK